MEELNKVSVNKKDKSPVKEKGTVFKEVLRVISGILILLLLVSTGFAAKSMMGMLDAEKAEIETASKYMERGEYDSACVILEAFYDARFGEGYNENFDFLYEYRKARKTSKDCVAALLEECKARME